MGQQGYLVRGLLSLLLPACATDPARLVSPTDHVAGELLLLDDNAGWCWFQDPRSLVDGDTLLAGTVADDAGVDGAARKGDVQLAVLDLGNGEVQRVVLHAGLQDDDHDAPALLRLPDGRYLAAYGKHGTDRLMRWRISSTPGDATAWGPERTADAGAAYTYQNLFLLPGDGGRIYNFHRGIGFNPNFLLSEDGGASFRYGGRLLQWTAADHELYGAGRPYLRYASNGVDTVHFLATEDHPRNFDNSLYHGFVRGGRMYDSSGTEVVPLSTTREAAAGPTAFTRVFAGDADNVAWCVDLELDAAGQPVALFSVQHGEALQYGYARFDGVRWHTHFLAHAGRRLYAPEVDYSGLGAIDPDHPEVVYVSTDAHPASGEPLVSRADGRRHREIWRGVTADGGASWTWSAVTADSSVDNLRPTVPARNGGRTALLWLRGAYRTYRDYDTQLVGMLLDRR
jgi:hypothetical protein